MELNGFVQNGVIVLTGGASLPEGTPVTVSCGVDATTTPVGERKYIVFPLVDSDTPGVLTNERIAEILEEEDLEYIRSFVGTLPIGNNSWNDDERDALRAEALNDLGWEGMEAYQLPGDSAVIQQVGEPAA